MTEIESPPFIPGQKLAGLFFEECVRPVLSRHFPSLAYSAALIGPGSEVLGFDTEMSADHHWGPRVMLFVGEDDHKRYAAAIRETLARDLPRRVRGFSTSFSAPDPDENGVQMLDYESEGPVNHRVDVLTIRDFLESYLGFNIENGISSLDWLTFSQQKLRSIACGAVFHDDAGLQALKDTLAYYPHDVWLYLMCSAWTRIEQEEHLMGRAGVVGDEIGSAIIGARLVRDLIRLVFLMERAYAPYAKWLGTAFSQLPPASDLSPHLLGALAARTWQERESHLVPAYEAAARMHNRLGVTEPVACEAVYFHGRPFRVISQGRFSAALASAIQDADLKRLATRRPIGNIDLASDNTDLLEDQHRRAAFRALIESGSG